MATIQDRPFSRDYSGLRNQLEVGGVLVALCLTGYELMRRKRRGRGLRAREQEQDGVGSVETWEFGYLYQGRCWAKKPSPALPKWPLAWVKQAIKIPERTLPDLIGIDATLYIRFLTGCWYFALLHTCTTFPILFSIHVVFSPADISNKSMNKASISSLVQSPNSLRLLYVHAVLAYWITSTWILTLLWLARATFRYRALAIQTAATALASRPADDMGRERVEDADRGLRLRTVMVTNIPPQLRSEKKLKEYFEYYMARPMGTAPIAPGFLPKMMTFLFNRAAASAAVQHFKADPTAADTDAGEDTSAALPAIVERVIVARKMTELVSLLERRQEVLKKLEYAHMRLARNALHAARAHLDDPAAGPESKGLLARVTSRRSWVSNRERAQDEEADPAARTAHITDILAPFVSEFHVPSPRPIRHKLARLLHHSTGTGGSPTDSCPPSTHTSPPATIWEALHNVPRSHLDAFQPLIRLNALFRGAAVPAIDYYAAKLGLLTALIGENRGRAQEAYTPSSTAFVTFDKIDDARRAAKYMQVHPKNPLACVVVPAPDVADLDWGRVMKSAFTGEFLKDWVVNLGVWAFTCLWIIPISLLVGLVSIQNLSIFLPGLQRYLDKHPRDQEVISSLLPTILVSILTILIPMILLLIAKKAHTIITFSKLHDTIMIRYWKFLVCNLLIFFCVGVAALESFLQSFRNSVNPLPLIAGSFPTAGPFYVGWLILQTAIHGFLELGLFGLPLIVYPATKAATTLRRRAAGILPRTFNFYYWLPNHVLVMTIIVCFALLNPLVIPFALVYFSVESVIVKHQLVHVYAKTYDNNGKLILIRIVRYSLDGLILAHVVFLAFLVVLKEKGEAAMTGVLLGLTAIAKIVLTQLCRAKFAESDRAEDAVYSGGEHEFTSPDSMIHDSVQGTVDPNSRIATLGSMFPYGNSRFWTWKLPAGAQFSYSSVPVRAQNPTRRGANPFGPNASFTRITSNEKEPERAAHTMVTRDITDVDADMQEDVAGPADVDEKRSHAAPNGASQTPLARRDTTATRRSMKPPLVSPHTKHPNWDDFPHLNRPYENPYYVAPVDNFLWLPRNPFGVLDLDDSVDLHRALTSEPGAGQLGQWMNETIDDQTRLSESGPLVETPSSIMYSPESGVSESIRDGFPFGTEHRLSGTEDISMSSVLSTRANNIDREVEVEQASRTRSHSNLYGNGRLSLGRRTGTGRRPSTAGSRGPSMFSNSGGPPIIFNGRSISGTPGQRRPSSSMAMSARRPSTSRTYDPVNEPDLQAEAVFVESTLSVPLSTRTRGSRLTERRERSQGPPVPMHDAVVGEIIVEEQAEAIERIRREEEEKREKEAQKPSWWNAWLWNRSKHEAEHPSSDPSNSNTPGG